MKGPIARGTIRTTFVLLFRLLIQAGTLLLVARLLGPDRFGAFAGIAALAVMLGTLSTFGTHLVLLGEVSKDPTQREGVLCYALPTTFLCGGSLLLVYLLACTWLFSKADISILALLAIGAAETCLQPLLALAAAEHLGMGRTARSQLLLTLPLGLRLAAAGSILLLDPLDRLASYAYGYFGASIVAISVAAMAMAAPWPSPQRWRLARKRELVEAAGYGALAVSANSPAELDKTLAAKLLPLSAAGLYSAGARIIGAATLPVAAMMLSALPRLFREASYQARHPAHLLRWIFGAALGYSIALAVLLYFCAPALDWLFGPHYYGLGEMTRWLCIAMPGMSLRMAGGSILMAFGKPWMRFGFELAGLVILFLSAVSLVTHWGQLGLPLALACSEWSMAAIGLCLVLVVKRSTPKA